MTTQKKPAARKSAARKQPELTDEQRQATLEAYNALQQVGLPIPAELAIVDEWVAEIQAQRVAEAQQHEVEAQAQEEAVAQANANGPWYVRNCYPAPFNFRLDRQTEKRRIELKALGSPGDLHPLKDEDLDDPILKRNVASGLLEVVPAGVAQMIIEKQATNMGRRVHTPLAMLRNESNQPYQQGAVKVEAEFNSQGVTVARVDPGILQGQVHDKDVGGRKSWGGLQRTQPGQPSTVQGGNQVQAEQATSVVRSGFVPTAGNPAIVQYGPHGSMDANARAKAVDDLARRRGSGGLGAGLGDVTVTVEPTVKT